MGKSVQLMRGVGWAKGRNNGLQARKPAATFFSDSYGCDLDMYQESFNL